MRHLLPDREVVVFDLETTDTDLAMAAGVLPEPVELGALLINSNYEVQDSVTFLIQPKKLDSFTEFSEQLTGITRRELEKAKKWEEQWRQFAGLSSFNQKPLMAWGKFFDAGVLRAAYARSRLGFPHRPAILDALSIAYGFAIRWGFNFGSYSLGEVANYFGIPRQSKHRALPDAITIVEVLVKLAEYGDGV